VPTTLYDLDMGDVARIVRIQDKTSLSLRRRLLDMGITKGAVLRVERHAPLGDPVQIFVKGYRLAVRLSEARTIEVEPIGTAETAGAES
jgi:Fe2+ transport system protein FeoA